jgi:hypothetical protein
MSLVEYAESELDRIGITDDDDMNGTMRKHLLHMVKEFADEGHSGFSANYALQCLHKLLKFKPLSPLTGEDDEWTEVSQRSGYPHFQNKRCSSVFKDGKNGEVYDIDGKVFWEWCKDEDGNPYKSYYTNRESRVSVTFPYTVPDEPIYEWRYSDADPQQPAQTEEGFV